jgi:hypothetical protein
VACSGDTNDLKVMQTKHRLIVAMHLQGRTTHEISAAVSIRPERIRQILNSPIVRTHVARLLATRDSRVAEMKAEIDEAVAKALHLLNTAVDGTVRALVMNKETGEYEEVDQLVPVGKRLDAAKDLLDRSSHTAKVRRILDETPNGALTDSDVSDIRNRYLQLRGIELPVTSQPVGSLASPATTSSPFVSVCAEQPLDPATEQLLAEALANVEEEYSNLTLGMNTLV